MIQNCYSYAWERRGQTTCQWGKDNTGLIEYKINDQGFRSPQNYNTVPDYAFFGNSIVFGVGVDQAQTLVSYFENSHNYGLSGNYMNHHSVTNLQCFATNESYRSKIRVVFFWIDRPEPIEDMIQQVNQIIPGVLHISSGQKKRGAINLMPHIDSDVSGTHPGPKTHRMWAKTIKLLLNRDR